MKKIANKILITGNAGSGKTTLSLMLTKLLDNYRLIHIDRLVWTNRWELVSKEHREKFYNELKTQKSWIADGVSKTLLHDADTIIFLDYPRHVCYFRALKRTIKYAFQSRPELANQSPEIFVLGKLLKIIWIFPKVTRPDIIKYIGTHSNSKSIYHIQNKKEFESVLSTIQHQLAK